MKVENIKYENYSTTALLIDKVLNSEFGDYTCRVTNNIGYDEATTHVSGKK